MPPTILSCSNLGRTFRTESREIAANQDIDLSICEGEFICLMGSSGSGKSTLLYLLSGLDKPDSGTILFKNHKIHELSEHDLALLRRWAFGFVFQNINLLPTLSILENVIIAGFLKTGRSLAKRQEVHFRAHELLSRLNIDHLAMQLPNQASGGEQQRAAIARALINEPSILFADEPTGALNHASGQVLLDHLNTINAKGQTIVMVSHDVKAAARASRVVFLRDGSIQGELSFDEAASANPEQLLARERKLSSWLIERGW